MSSFRQFLHIGAAIGALVFVAPVMAGTLAPQLRTLLDSWRQTPETSITRAAQAPAQTPRLFSPHVRASGAVQVYIHYQSGRVPSPEALASLDASDVLVSPSLGVVQAWIPIAKLQAAAALPGINRVALPVYGWTKSAPAKSRAHDSCSGVPGDLDINQEGIAAENVQWLHDHGITGAGVKMGIISDGVDCIADSQAKDYLPSNVWIHPTLSGYGDEGTAMLELAHALAPDTTLGFCGYEPNGSMTTADFVQCLNDLAAWGADVISDDLGWAPVGYNFSVFTNPVTGDNAIVEFANAHPGISLTTSAGNDRYDYFEGDYIAMAQPDSPSGVHLSLSPQYTVGNCDCGVAGRRSYASAMNFGAAAATSDDAAMTVTIYEYEAPAHATLFANLSWNDPVNGPYDDMDLFLLKQDGTVACQPTSSQWCSSTIDQMDNPSSSALPGWEPPVEYIHYTNDSGSKQTLYLVALCYDCLAHGSQPLHIKLYGFLNAGGFFNYNSDGGISGHAALDVELTTAAACYVPSSLNCAGPLLGVNSSMEAFSTTGPFNYGDWSNGTKSRNKPDITGTDAVTVSGAGGFGQASQSGDGAVFYGTSAASPNVGSVIALLRSAVPSGQPNAAGWKQLVLDHASSSAIFDYSVNASGAGLVDAAAALAALDQPMNPVITAPSGSTAQVNPNTDVQFAGLCNYSGHLALSYQWGFGKPGSGAPPDVTGLNPPPVQYANGGLYTASFTCTDRFQFQSGEKTIAVQAAATARDYTFTIPRDDYFGAELTATGIGGEQVHFVVVKDPEHADGFGLYLYTGDSTGNFYYRPVEGYVGTDTIQYRIDNGVMPSNTATITIHVSSNQAPDARGDRILTVEGQSVSGTLHATDPDGDPLTFSIVSQPEHGTVAINNAATGAFTYQPDRDYSGMDGFRFQASDGTFSGSAQMTVEITQASGDGAFSGLGLGLLGALLLLALRRKR